MRKTKKERLIERAEQWQKSSQEMSLMCYPRTDQPELQTALKIAGDIISEEMKHDAIL